MTSLALRTVPAPEATNFHLAWPFRRAAAVVEAWQGWAPVGPDELAASLKVTAAGELDRPASVDVYGAFLGAESDATDLLDDLVVRVGSDPIRASAEHMSFSETRRFWAELGVVENRNGRDSPAPSAQQPHLFTKSEFFKRPLPPDAGAALVENFLKGRTPAESRELDFMPWGGAYNRVRPDATAFVHRDELFQLKHSVAVDPEASMREKAAAHRWVTRSCAAVHPWGSGPVFQNFADPELEDWAGAYYGPNYQRLLRVKSQYDPGLLPFSTVATRSLTIDVGSARTSQLVRYQRGFLLIASAAPTPRSPGSTTASGAFTPSTAAGGDLRLVLGCGESTA